MNRPRGRRPVALALVLLAPALAAAGEAPAPGPGLRGPEAALTPDGDPPWIGIELGAGKAGGVAIVRVVEGSPGDRAHLRAGDEIVELDGQPASTPAAAIGWVRSRAVGAIVHLRLAEPAGKEVLVKLEPRPDPLALQRRTLEGKPAPDFTPTVQLGPRVERLSSLKGRVVLLDFFATWCQPCMQALPRLAALHRELAPRGLTVIGLSDEPAAVLEEVRQHGARYTLVADGASEVGGRYQLRALPTLVVVDRRGVVRKVVVADEDEAERAVRELLAEH